jgi:drug/metabolite transporter (DMT)-like permease
LTGRIRRLLLLAFIWGWSFLFIKVSVEGMSPPTVAWARVTLGALVLLVVLRVTRRTLPRDVAIWRRFAVVSVFANVIPFTLLAWGEERIASALASVLNASTPLFTACIAAGYLRDRLRPVQVAGLVVGFGGVAVAAGLGAGDLGDSSVAGSVACVVAGLCYGIAFVYMRRHFVSLEPTVAATGQLVMASVLSLPFAVGTSIGAGVSLTPRRLLAIGTLGIVGTGLAYILNYRIIRDSGATRASLVTYLVPVVAVVVGIVVLGETFEWRIVWGGALVIGGLVLLRERPRLRLPVPSGAAAAVALVVLAGTLVGCGGGTGTSACAPAHAEALDPSLTHVFANGPEPRYTTDPPTSGPHTPGAIPKGVLSVPLARPAQVGALEAGVVLLQFRDLSDAEQQQLAQLVTDKVVVAPNAALPDRVVATAWLFKQVCSKVDQASLRGFIRQHVGQGPGADG